MNTKTTSAQGQPVAAAGVVSTALLGPLDSRLVYIVCHLASLAKNLAVFGGVVWLAYALKSGWVLWALLLCPWSTYKHDFGKSHMPNTV
jgi:hypothetical protein